MTSHTLTATDEDDGLRVDQYIVHHIEEIPSRTVGKRLIEEGLVRVNGEGVKPRAKVRAGDRVEVNVPAETRPPGRLEPENIPLEILYDDAFLCAVNKPVGMMVHPAPGIYHGTLVNALLYRFPSLSDSNTAMRPGIVHRLDQETSGVILVAKDNITHARLARLFEKRRIRKVYRALVEGVVEYDEGLIDRPIGRHRIHRDKMAVVPPGAGRDSETRYRVLERRVEKTLIELYPKTGRTHQLRVHMAWLGHPILGDAKYGHKNTHPRLALHAREITFQHPHTTHNLTITAPEAF